MEETREIAVVYLQPAVVEKVRLSKDIRCVLLIGYFDFWKNRAIICNHINILQSDSLDLASTKHHVESYLPAGIGIIGLWKPDVESDISEITDWEETKVLSYQTQNNRLLIITDSFNSDEKFADISALLFVCELERPCFYCNVKVAATPDCFASENTISLKANFTINLEFQVNDFMNEEICNAFCKLESRFNVVDRSDVDKEPRMFANVYKTNTGNVLLTDDLNSSYVLNGNLSTEKSCVLDLLKYLYRQDDKKLKRNNFKFTEDFIDFTLLQDITAKNDVDSRKYVPIIHYEMCDFIISTIPIRFRPTVLCSVYTKLADLPYLFNEAILRQIRCAQSCIMEFSKISKLDDIVTPEPFVFYPKCLGHFLVAYYPKGVSEDDLESYRRELCQLWNLPSDRLVIRKNNSYYFPEERGVYLRNVHNYLGPSGIIGGIQALVDGNYEYHHYMQDNFDDKGWGCAYRSFQTMWSWFVLQGYTEKTVPSHREIQQALIDIGDRPQNFLGTRQWIGSLELSYCLSHLIKVESKILNVSNGAELTTKVRQLIAHFETEGTPVMIGGGVLAHSILGVHFSEETGEIKYLVLDPHYTGEENIKTIIDKGWCGWKASTFWSDDAFYNLLLPQRPKNVV